MVRGPEAVSVVGPRVLYHAVHVQTQPATGFLFNVSNEAVSGTPVHYYSAFFVVVK